MMTSTDTLNQTVISGIDFDCSSLVWHTVTKEGFNLGPAEDFYTGNMDKNLRNAGFIKTKFDRDDLKPGDIFLVEKEERGRRWGHTEIYVGDNQTVGAHGSLETMPGYRYGIHGQLGDKTGNEISIVKCEDYDWTYRPPREYMEKINKDRFSKEILSMRDPNNVMSRMTSANEQSIKNKPPYKQESYRNNIIKTNKSHKKSFTEKIKSNATKMSRQIKKTVKKASNRFKKFVARSKQSVKKKIVAFSNPMKKAFRRNEKKRAVVANKKRNYATRSSTRTRRPSKKRRVAVASRPKANLSRFAALSAKSKSSKAIVKGNNKTANRNLGRGR